MKNSNLFLSILMCVLFLHLGLLSRGQSVTTERLIDDMTDLERLTRYPGRSYKTVQFSSYDRRSTSPYESGWFANSDGFGGEPEPGFEKVLREPDEDGIGEYLICDVQKPGAIVRLWTARINGSIRVFLDDMKKPAFEGKAEEFFWNTYQALSGKETPEKYQNSLRQYDAFYFLITFSERCRIEWTGNIDKLHFYHIQMRLYDRETSVNYSWSSRAIFDHAYCGQPRNDGPGNRGFVTNYRYQILDDVPFENRIDFYMELLSHSRVSNFSYSRITYLYAFPHFNDDHREVSKQDVVMPELPEWNQPEARFGAANSVFYEAETLCKDPSMITIRKGDIWTKDKYMLWKSGAKGETLKLQIPVVKDTTVNIALTAAHSPESGNISLRMDGNDLKFGNESIIDLHQEYTLVSRNHVSQKIELEEGLHELIIENMQEGPNSVGIDFVWVKY